jgi:hypothetical protein
MKAYKEVRIYNRKVYQKNKTYYDKKPKESKFAVNDKAYLFCCARRSGRCHTFRPFWQGPFVGVQTLCDLNYKIVDKKGKESVVHINRLKKSYDQTPWKSEMARRPRQKTRQLVQIPLMGMWKHSHGLSQLLMNANPLLLKRKPWRRTNCS